MSIGTHPRLVVALFLSVPSERLRDWRHRGLIGDTCDVRTRAVGFDITEVSRVMRSLRRTRPRVALDDETWRYNAERVR